MLPRIDKIISINGADIVCLWNTGETKTVRLEKLLKENHETLGKLLPPEKIALAKLDAITKTLYWDHILNYTDLDGNIKKAPLDLCPDTLYKLCN